MRRMISAWLTPPAPCSTGAITRCLPRSAILSSSRLSLSSSFIPPWLPLCPARLHWLLRHWGRAGSGERGTLSLELGDAHVERPDSRVVAGERDLTTPQAVRQSLSDGFRLGDLEVEASGLAGDRGCCSLDCSHVARVRQDLDREHGCGFIQGTLVYRGLPASSDALNTPVMAAYRSVRVGFQLLAGSAVQGEAAAWHSADGECRAEVAGRPPAAARCEERAYTFEVFFADERLEGLAVR